MSQNGEVEGANRCGWSLKLAQGRQGRKVTMFRKLFEETKKPNENSNDMWKNRYLGEVMFVEMKTPPDFANAMRK